VDFSQLGKPRLENVEVSVSEFRADLFMGGFSRQKNEFEILQEIGQAGFDIYLSVKKLRDNPRTLCVKFLYNPCVYNSAALLDPNTYGFSNVLSIEIKRWDSR